jgi:type II secretory pathway predicted ATPase ExeA
MGKPEPISVIRSVAEPVAAAVAATSPRPFAGDSAGSGYFESDHHHRYVAAAIFRELAKGHGLVLLCGEHTADVDLVERFLNEEGRERYRASLVRCRPEMDFGALVRAYNRRLGLRQEAGSDGIWALLSHLMAEVRKGVRRLLVLENAESLDLTCFDELLRFMRLDEPHVMPVVLLGSADFAERLATPAFGFLNSAITGRVPFDRIDQDEVGAFLHYQLNVLPGDESALFPPEVVNLIAVRAGGNAAVINRLALDVLEQGRRDATPAAAPEPAPVPPIAVVPPAEEAAPEPSEEPEVSEEPEQAEPIKAESPEEEPLTAEPAEAEPLKAEPPARLVAGGRPAMSGMTETTEKRRARLSVRSGLALYVVAAVLAGLGLLYVLAPRGHEPSATVASTAGSAETPPLAAPEKSAASAPAAKEAPSDAAAAQAAAVEPAAGPSAAPAPASSPEATPDQNGPVVIGAKIVPLTPPAPAAPDAAASAAPAPAAPATPESTASSSEPAAAAPSEPAAPAQPPVASATPQPPANPPASPAPASAADAAPATPAPTPTSEAAAQPASPAPSEAAAAAPSEAAPPAAPKAGTSMASEPAVSAASQPASPAPAAQAAAPAASGATQAIAPLAALEPAKVPSQEQQPQPQPPKAAHPNAELTLLVQRGDELLAAGDIFSARQFYERAAQAGDAAAECGLGKSYDPVFLRQLGARGVAGNAATAAGWYRRAAAAGNNEAAARLARLDATDPNRSNSK